MVRLPSLSHSFLFFCLGNRTDSIKIELRSPYIVCAVLALCSSSLDCLERGVRDGTSLTMKGEQLKK